MVKAKEEDEE